MNCATPRATYFPINLVDPSGLTDEDGDGDDDFNEPTRIPPISVVPHGGPYLDHNGKTDFPISSGGGGGGNRGWGSTLPIPGGPPNGALSAGKGDAGTIRDYDENGNAVRNNDFGHDYHGVGDPHVHDWPCDKNGIPRRKKIPRLLNEGE